MRLIEILLVVLVLVGSLLGCYRTPRRPLLICVSILAGIALLVHVIIEGPHWQMAPAYLAAILLITLCVLREARTRRILAAASIGFLIAACAFSAILPMFRLPRPTGSYATGTVILHLVNDHPPDPIAAGPDGKRELMVQIWYPASPSHLPRAPYRKFAETTLMSSYQAVLWTHARWNAPIASGQAPFPVLLLSPAWNGRRTDYMFLVEDLASHGYVVVGIDHTGNSGPTAFPDGHVSQPLPDPNLDFTTRTFSELNAYATRQLEVQTNDNRFALDQLAQINQQPASAFYHRLDMERVGAFGHSFGGAVSAQACLEDSRIKSALDMDGSLWGQVQQTGLAKPFMIIDEPPGDYAPSQLQNDREALNDHLLDLGDIAAMQRSNGFRIILHGATHTSFSDRSLYSPFRRLSGAGTLPAGREYFILREYVRAFFDATLLGKTEPLLTQRNPAFPEASFEVFHDQGGLYRTE